MYKLHNSSATSLSDDGDDDDKTILFSPSLRQSSPPLLPAHWSSSSRPNYMHSSKRSPMARLPTEILIHILKHLHSPRDVLSCLRVSRTWCECSVELLWHKPTFPRYETAQKMARLLARPGQTFRYPHFIRRLNFLSLGQQLTDDVFSSFVQCDRLERLTLVGCENLSGDALTRILQSFSNLVAIDLSGAIQTTNETIIGLASAAQRLQGINLAGCAEVSNDGVTALSHNCPLLRRVKLSGLITLTDEPISLLARCCPLLLEIDLNQCELITDVAIRDIWIHSTHMREMRVSHCPLLTDSAFPSCLRPEAGPHPDAPDPFPCSLAKDAAELPPLILSRTLEHLRMLDMTACPLVTDDAIEGIISHAPKIRNLVLSKCSLLTDRAVENICRLGRHLHYLHLGHAAKITDRSVRTLARSCTRLRYVDFANCILLTDMSVFELSALPKLRRVGLVRVTNLTDEAIYSLAERHASLERIHLSYCDQISVMAIHFLLQKLHKLTHLSLTGIPAFRQPELQQFCREPPRDFNSTQQLAFCVYSGKGISQLRAFLTELFDHMTEMNGTDDTDYEDEDEDVDALIEEDNPERFGYNDDDDQLYTSLPRRAEPTAYQADDPAALAHNVPRSHEFTLRRDRVTRGTTIPPRQNSLQVLPSFNIRGAESRLSARIASSSNTGPLPPRRLRGDGQGLRSVTDMLPIIESSVSPPPSDVASNRSERTNHSNGATFFRTYQEGALAGGLSRNTGALTPDLNYAEIGHGRGADDTSTPVLPQLQFRQDRGGFTRYRDARVDDEQTSLPSLFSQQRLDEFQNNRTAYTPPSPSQTHDVVVEANSPSVVWPYREPASPLPDQAESQPAEPIVGIDGRGRTAKRNLRSTLNVAEHYASSFFFGRSQDSSNNSNIDGRRGAGTSGGR